MRASEEDISQVLCSAFTSVGIVLAIEVPVRLFLSFTAVNYSGIISSSQMVSSQSRIICEGRYPLIWQPLFWP